MNIKTIKYNRKINIKYIKVCGLISISQMAATRQNCQPPTIINTSGTTRNIHSDKSVRAPAVNWRQWCLVGNDREPRMRWESTNEKGTTTPTTYIINIHTPIVNIHVFCYVDRGS